MITNKLIKTIFASVLTVGIAASTMLVTSEAEAGRGGRGHYVQKYELDRPLHGYEGHTHRGYYCSYKRLPNRVCTPTASGESCKVVGWTLEQTCQ